LRWSAVAAGAAFIGLAFFAATRVADTREGLIAEVVLLFAALAGIGLLVYGLAGRQRPVTNPSPTVAEITAAPAARPRSNRDLLTGAGGVVLAVALVTGLALSGGPLWAALGFALLLPMLAGSVYLFVRYLRSAGR
jgi:hypothetical protein